MRAVRKSEKSESGVFSREKRVLQQAREALSAGNDPGIRKALDGLCGEYDKLYRQTLKMVGMSDRMQGALNALNRNLAANERKYRGIFENVAEGIFRLDPDGRLVEVNPAMAAMFGFASPQDFLQQVGTVAELFCQRGDRERFEAGISETGGVQRFEARMLGLGEKILWGEFSATVLGDGEPESGGVVGVVADVTERRRMHEEMCRLARTDCLTGLWNRRYFLELGGRELSRAVRKRLPVSLLMVDIDHFKAVNDTYGHDIGDLALKRVAEVLRDNVRDLDVAARIGGEEFAVLLPEASVREGALAGERVLRAVREERICGPDMWFGVTVSVGVSTMSGAPCMDDLLKKADMALYAAKECGRDRMLCFSDMDRGGAETSNKERA